MNTLITPTQVVRLAFSPDESLPPEAVTDADIAAAAQRYLIPVIGSPLYERLMTEVDRSFIDHYVAAPLALFTRLLIQPRLDIRTGRCGTTSPNTTARPPPPKRHAACNDKRCSPRLGHSCAVRSTASSSIPKPFRNTIRNKTHSNAVRSMESWYRFISGAAAGLAAIFAPIAPAIVCAVCFIGVDFVTGILADRTTTLRAGRPWYFESCKAWRTVVKLALTLTAIVMAWLLDRYVLDFCI